MASVLEADSSLDVKIQRALARFWGFSALRPLQQEVVTAALNNRDAVVVMPTGGGKSLCFQLPAVVSETLTVVVSPLIALMKDQVDALSIVGVPAAALNSSLSPAEESDVQRKLARGEIRLLYISPERLLLSATQRLLAQADGGRGVARFAIDEAHCISAWGHDFRPEFRQLSRIKQVFPGVPVQAFTATATPQVQRDIAIQLNLERPRKFVGVFDRPNLTYSVVAKDGSIQRMVEAVRRYPDEGVIVYCLSRKDTETVAAALQANGIAAVAYHAGLPNETRRRVSEDFAREKANVIVATIAFGMGIDRANVRCVIHECLPKSMEGYQQETGRAGRDGLPSECVLLYSNGDVLRLKRLLSEGADPEIVAHHTRLLDEVQRFATSHRCRHKSLSEHFGQAYESGPEGCGACDVCLGGMKPLPNGSEIAHRILGTCSELIARRRFSSFGVNYLVSVLTGSRAKVVLEREGNTASGFGAFAAEPAGRVSAWIHQLSDLGLLAVSGGRYPVLSLTEEGVAALRDRSEINLVENVALQMVTGSRKSRSSEPVIENIDAALYEKLRVWRRSVAAERAVPAYVIFHDATLMRIAAILPSSSDRLLAIAGVGERRAEDFGAEVLSLVSQHAIETGVARDRPLTVTEAAPSGRPVTSKIEMYAGLFRSGRSIEEIAAQVGVSHSTVWRQLADWVEREKPRSIESWVDPETYKRAAAALGSNHAQYLQPIYESLNGEIPYDKLRAVQAHLRSL